MASPWRIRRVYGGGQGIKPVRVASDLVAIILDAAFWAQILSVKVAVATPPTCLCGRGMKITENNLVTCPKPPHPPTHERAFISVSQALLTFPPIS